MTDIERARPPMAASLPFYGQQWSTWSMPIGVLLRSVNQWRRGQNVTRPTDIAERSRGADDVSHAGNRR